MPLTVLLPLVVFGIAGIAILLHRSGLTAPRRFQDIADVEAAWLREFPDMRPLETHIDRKNQNAVIRTEQGSGLVWCIGADTVARPLEDFAVLETENGLDIKFDDFSAPRAELSLSETDRLYWKTLLDPS
ncbi:hypothetical protein [Shimia thalassica]|uniref:hypothetical protein n=1 Tax=Shimia thalassica TaxID=1715693 RepID=UPI0026E3E431|nr:hypothetical protein [Shimia thalassica]MDO6484736.1 hypothetical protein [Shimia thalassica]MDO6797929.1 hypothetical protein [Shimia thalassica]